MDAGKNSVDLLKGLDLFSGVGGITYALQEFIEPVAYCEIDPYCQSVLLSRMQTGDLPKAPIWDDVRTLPFKELPPIDIICGGFPCQDISVAGTGKGLAGERSGLFFEIVRLAKEIKPKFIFLENVPAITTRGGLQVIREIAEMGYDCRWCVVSAASVGALHRRERWFLLACSQHDGALASETGRGIGESTIQGKQPKQTENIGETERTSGLPSILANATSKSTNRHAKREKSSHTLPTHSSYDGDTNSESSKQTNSFAESFKSEWRTRGRSSGFYRPFESREHWQKTVSEMGKCSDGVPYHVDRLRSLGNAVVPQQARKAFLLLSGWRENNES